MDDTHKFQRVTAIAAILALPAAWGGLIIGLMAVGYDFEVFSDTHTLIAIGSEAANLIRWSLILAMFGNYLLLIPLALFLWHWLRPHSPLYATFYTLGGLMYIFLGAMGGAIMTVVWPLLINEFAQAPEAQKETLVMLFQVITRLAEGGFQGALQNIPGGIWFLGMGLLLRQERRMLGYYDVIVGFFLLVNALGGILQSEPLSMIGLTANLLLVPVWAMWLGLELLRKHI
ncbi:MAG: DUF4386 family protein [Chloroflexota bacterium]